MKYNLHTHSFYCGHGTGTIKEYADYAEEKGFDLLGFSEHVPFPDNHFSSSRMDYSLKGVYESDVRAEKDRGMKVLLGYECDYIPKWKGYFEDIKGSVDYLIAGTHYLKNSEGDIVTPFHGPFTQKDYPLYVKNVIDAMSSGLFLFMAHPDVFLCNIPFDNEAKAASKDIVDAAVDLDLPLEFNSNGLYKASLSNIQGAGYPNKGFWEIAIDRGVRTVLSSDAHAVVNLDKYLDQVLSLAESFRIDLLEPILDGDIVIGFKNLERW